MASLAALIPGIGDIFVNLWSAWRKDRELQAWIRLGLSTFYSGLISFLTTTGFQLIHHIPWPIAIGMGLVVSAGAIFTVLTVSPQGRSLVIKLPAPVAEAIGAPPEPLPKPAVEKKKQVEEPVEPGEPYGD